MLRLLCVLFMLEIFALHFSHARRQYLNEREVYQEPFPELSHNAEYHRSHQLPPIDNDRRLLVDGVPSQPRPSSVQQREINDLTLKLVNRGPVNPIELEKTLPKRKPPLVTTNCTYGLCEDVPDYPTERILALLKKNVALKQYFSDVLPVPDIGNRGTFGDGETLCDTKTHTKFPKLAKNIDNVEKTIVNVDKHQQGIVFETCGTEDGACRFSEAFPDGYVSSCKQKYVQRRMMVMSNSNENLVFDNFEFPSCCICILKKS